MDVVEVGRAHSGPGVENFQTAAGPANDNLGSINGGPANFTPFHGTPDEFAGLNSEGTLGGTSPTAAATRTASSGIGRNTTVLIFGAPLK